MKKNRIFILVLFYCFFLFFTENNPYALAEDEFQSLRNSELSEFSMGQTEEFEKYRDKINEEYKIYKNIINEEFNTYKKEITKYWEDGQVSGVKKWIEYSKDYKTRKSVDFEKGIIEVEIIADKNLDNESIDKQLTLNLMDLAGETGKTALLRDSFARNVEKRLVASIEDIKVTDSIAEAPVISDIITDTAAPDDKEIAKAVKALKNKGEISEKPAKTANEKIVLIKIKIPDEKMQRKALQYVENVKKYSAERKLDPALVFAIMQTESSFNPMARSYVPAYGLMQIVPRSAGKDASKVVFGKPMLLAPSFLYDCDNNIKMGTAYISVLTYRYLRAVKNDMSRKYCAIAAYNTGTGNVAKAFIGRVGMKDAAAVINKLTPDQVFNTLVEKLPYDETKHYLKKVKTRMQHYEKI